MAELVYQTYERITGKPWSTARANGLTDGSSASNLALQQKLLSGWNPYATAQETVQQQSGGQSGGDSLDGYIEKATAKMGSAYEEASNSVISAAKGMQTQYEQMAQNVESRVTSVQQTYANLAKELGASQVRETDIAARVGEQNIGSARSSVAAAGIGEGQGSFRAVITAAQDEMLANVGTIADKYNLKQESLASEMNNTILEIFEKASEYRLQGQKALSEATIEVAKMKIDKQKEILSLAQQLYGNDLELRKFEAQLAENERQYNLELAKFAESKRQFGISQSTKNQEQAAKAYKYTVKEDNAGLDFYDENGIPVSPWEFFAAKGATLGEIRSVFAQSEDEKDQGIVRMIDLEKRRGTSDSQIYAALQSKYTF